MKPFQFYVVRRFPALEASRTIRNQIQMTLSGEDEKVETSISLTKKDFHGPFSKLQIVTGVRHNTFGYLKTIVDNKRRTLTFTEFIQPVDFPAYYDEARNVILFQASKKVCRGLISNLRDGATGIDLVEMEVDFRQIFDICPEYLAAWFRDVSSRVKSAGVSGAQIQNDSIFKSMLKLGRMSSVIISWPHEDVHHPMVITSSGSVVLVKNYRKIPSLELQLVIDVYENLLSKVWRERKARKDDPDSYIEPH